MVHGQLSPNKAALRRLERKRMKEELLVLYARERRRGHHRLVSKIGFNKI